MLSYECSEEYTACNFRAEVRSISGSGQIITALGTGSEQVEWSVKSEAMKKGDKAISRPI
jgi:hypothetical protein